ncbi:MAG: hypothetical protein HY720_02850 [Planctomycetes bacterium]|nr:hypothetical protein [Planctomycetota bacterium]
MSVIPIPTRTRAVGEELEAAERAFAEGREESALDSADRLLRLDPEGSEENERLATLLAALGRHRDAAGRFQKVAVEAGRIAEAAALRIGVSELAAGRVQAGLAWLSGLSTWLPAYHRIARQVAELRLDAGDSFGAIQELVRQLDLLGDDPRTHILLGDAYVRIEAYGMAAWHYRIASELDPSRKAPELRLRRLGERASCDTGLALAGGRRLSTNLAALRETRPEIASFLAELPRPSEWTPFSIAGGSVRARDRRGRWVNGHYGPPRTGPGPATGGARLQRCPVFLGCGTGYGLRRFLAATESVEGLPGKKIPVYVIEPDADLFRLALETHDWADWIRSGRLFPFVGPGAEERALDFFADLAGEEWQFPRIVSELEKGRAAPFMRRFDAVRRARDARYRADVARTQALHTGRGASERARVFSEAAGRPVRVLANASRFAPDLLGSLADLVAEFRREGHEAELLVETRDTGLILERDVARRVAAFEPDLILAAESVEPPARTASTALIPAGILLAGSGSPTLACAVADPSAISPLDVLLAPRAEILAGIDVPGTRLAVLPAEGRARAILAHMARAFGG